MNAAGEIRDVFGIFHDGGISNVTMANGGGEIEVEIEYLAKRIQPEFTAFTIRLDALEHIKFSPWVDEGQPPIPAIEDLAKIACLDLEILRTEAKGHTVRVACSVFGAQPAYTGGVLQFGASRYSVFDESRREWTLEELRSLSDGYWSDWSATKKRTQQEPRGKRN